ncbi:alpha/beta hydrolase [Palleronia sp. KMU-117]|uniref:alpha/beta hydrolase n=1 Tax=Palleronia sp. KMU-117 TaxID=3434108 RepID=UPI003D73B51E
MPAPKTFETPMGRRLAYHATPGQGPGVVFLGGLRSDMEGSKALFLEDWARKADRAFLRFDYSGHGQSSGEFTEGCIGDWAEDALAAISALTRGPQVLVGSSMGGWISLLVARSGKVPLAGLVGIAAAPDFTEDGMWAEFTDGERRALMTDGRVERPSEYSDEPYIITRRMIEDGRSHLVLRSPLRFDMPVRLLQGSADTDVLPAVGLRLFDHLEGPDIRLTLVKDADHRFSTPDCLQLIRAAVEDVLARAADGA